MKIRSYYYDWRYGDGKNGGSTFFVIVTGSLLALMVSIIILLSGCDNHNQIEDSDTVLSDTVLSDTVLYEENSGKTYYHIEITKGKEGKLGYTKVYNEFVYTVEWDDVYKTYDKDTGETVITIRYKKLDE